jgi:TetR/AcrR family transcriptional regulator
MTLPKTSIRNPSAARQSEIIAVVLELAVSRSPALITTTDIASAMGLTQGAVFKHFPNKHSIWLAVMAWTNTTLTAALKTAAEQSPDALENLRAVFLEHVRFVIQHPGVPRLIFSELQQADDSPVKTEVRSLLIAYRQLLLRLLTQAENAGQLGEGVDKAAAAASFIGTIQGLVMQAMLAGSVDRMEEEARHAFPLYLRAIGVH